MSVLVQFVDMPLLFETGAYRLTWPRVLVYAGPEAQVCQGRCGSCSTAVCMRSIWSPKPTGDMRLCQVERLMQRDGCSRQQADAKIAAQMPLDAKRAKSQHVVDNSGAKQETEAQVRPGSQHPIICSCIMCVGFMLIGHGCFPLL